MTTTTVKINDPRITELSSLACSKRHKKIVWGCNDDPKTPDVFGIDTNTGKMVVEIEIDGMKLTDTEALDVTPDNKIVLGAIGDNDLNRSHISMFVFDEPKFLGNYHITDAAPYRLVYPDGKKYNAESLIVHPNTGRIFILTKQEGVCRIFVMPAIEELIKYNSKKPQANPLFFVGSFPLSLVTDATFTPDAEFMMLRQKGVKSEIAVVDCIALKVMKPFKVAKVKQPEALAIEPDGKTVIYGSEGKKSTLGRTTVPQEYT